MEAIEVQGLTKHYGELLAVDRISFRVEKGEFFGFLGPNGAGKTTTVRMLTGVIRPDSGRAWVAGYNVQQEPLAAKQLMGIVPEMANAYVDLSAWANLMLMGELYGVPKRARQERAKELLGEFGLHERKGQKVKAFSKGMRQRLILSMALINEPQILFLDEPTAGLDVQSARLIKEILQKLHEQGTTIFLTTHNLEEANQLCQRVAIISRGRIAAIDNPERLKRATEGLQVVEASFNRSVDMEELAALPDVNEIKPSGDKVKFYTDRPSEVIPHLADLARANGLKIIALNTLGPSLEDIFLKLTENHQG